MTLPSHHTPDGIEFVRTPDERFLDLPDFPYTPQFIDIEGLRMAYLDEGPAEAPMLLLLHGEPAWSYLYRRMIPALVRAGYRCIAPDLVGFGRSDKPVDRAAYSYANHLRWMTDFVQQLEIESATLFAQDWGGLIGLRLVTAMPERFARVAVGNTALPFGESAGPGFDSWLAFSQSDAFDDVGALFRRAVVARTLTPAEVDAYRAPFPDARFMAGVKAFPTLVPITPAHPQAEENRAAWKVLERFEKPFLSLWCPGDPVFGDAREALIDRIPGASRQPHQQFEPGGHFVQDDRGEDIAEALIAWIS